MPVWCSAWSRAHLLNGCRPWSAPKASTASRRSTAKPRAAGGQLPQDDRGRGLPGARRSDGATRSAAQAVYRSWNSERARTYRRLEHLDDLQGTAVTVQAMVFGNRGLTSGAGVAFSRDPSTGAAQPVIDVLFDSQGEDVVSGQPQSRHRGSRSPVRLRRLRRNCVRRWRGSNANSATCRTSSSPSKTANCGLLQTRSAKRTPRATLRFAIDFVKEGLITPSQALRRLNGVDLDATRASIAWSMPRRRLRTAPAHLRALRSDARPSIPRAPNAWLPAAIRSSWCGPIPARPMSRASPSPPAS